MKFSKNLGDLNIFGSLLQFQICTRITKTRIVLYITHMIVMDCYFDAVSVKNADAGAVRVMMVDQDILWLLTLPK